MLVASTPRQEARRAAKVSEMEGRRGTHCLQRAGYDRQDPLAPQSDPPLLHVLFLIGPRRRLSISLEARNIQSMKVDERERVAALRLSTQQDCPASESIPTHFPRFRSTPLSEIFRSPFVTFTRRNNRETSLALSSLCLPTGLITQWLICNW